MTGGRQMHFELRRTFAESVSIKRKSATHTKIRRFKKRMTSIIVELSAL